MSGNFSRASSVLRRVFQPELCRRFAACRVQPAHGHVQDRPELPPVWLLMEWPAEVEAPTQYWFSNLPEGVSLRRLVQLAKLRWRVGQNYQQLQREAICRLHDGLF